MNIFILEDDPQRMKLFHEVLGFNVVHRDNFEDAKEAFAKYKPFDLALLDHDLCDDHYIGKRLEENTGWNFAKWAAETQGCDDAIYTIIHSYNPDGAARMETLLQKAGWNAHRLPFGSKLLSWLKLFVKEDGSHAEPPAYPLNPK